VYGNSSLRIHNTNSTNSRRLGSVNSVAWSPNGKYLASGSNDETVCVWEAATGTVVSHLRVDHYVSSVAFAPCGDKLALAYYRSVAIFDVKTNKVLCTLHEHTDLVTGVAWNKDGTRLASCSFDKTVKIWADLFQGPDMGRGLCTLACQATLRVEHMATCLSYAPSSDILAAGDSGGNVHLFSADGETALSPLAGHRYALSSPLLAVSRACRERSLC